MLKRNSLFMFFSILLFIECRSQNHLVQQYFNKLENQVLSNCMQNDFTLYSLKKDSSNFNQLKEDCKVHALSYKRMNEGVIKLTDSPMIKNTKYDFLVINKITSNLTIPAPVISILKVKGNEELFIIETDAEDNITKKSYKKIEQNSDFLMKENKDIISIENYLIYGMKNNVYEVIDDNIESRSYHVVARINGEYIVKELFCIN